MIFHDALLFLLLATNAQLAAPACPGARVELTIGDYDGPVVLDLCVSRMNYAGSVLHASLYAPDVDGIFRNGFEAAP